MKQLTLLIFLSTFIGCSTEVHEWNVLYPSRATPLPNDSLCFQKLKGTNTAFLCEPGTTLRGIYLANPEANCTIIYFYGNAGKLLDQQIRFTLDSLSLALNANIISFDYRGYGYSDGDASLSAILHDGLKIYDFVRENWPTDTPIYLFGRSIGTGPAMYIASQRPCRGIILQSPFTSAAEAIPMWSGIIPWYLRLFISLKADSTLTNFKPQPIDLASSVTVPTLIIHGSKDELFSPKLGRKLFDHIASSDKAFFEVPSFGHNDLYPHRSPVVDTIRSFLMKN